MYVYNHIYKRCIFEKCANLIWRAVSYSGLSDGYMHQLNYANAVDT